MLKKLTERSLKIYFRDRTSVFFSLLSVIIVIVLYILFLAELQVNSVNQATGHVIPRDNLSYLINSWILAGLLSVTTVTSTLGALGTMVHDRERKIIMDFKSSPISGMIYPVSSVVTAFIVGGVISIISFAIYGAVIFAGTGHYFSVEQILKCFGLICLSSLMNASLMGFMVSFFKSSSALSSASIIIGTLIGFLNGLYVPMGSLPEAVQVFLKGLPFGHIASLFRQVLMTESLDLCFKDAPMQLREDYMTVFGVRFEWGDKIIGANFSAIFIIIVFAVSISLFFINYKRKKEEF